MTDELRNQVSAYLDNELPEAESELFVRRLCVDDELRDTLGRFSLIGDAIRGDSVTVPAMFASGVAARLDGEIESDGLPGERATAAPASSGRFFRPLAAAAIAVAVAATAVLSLNSGSVLEQDPVVVAGSAAPPIVTAEPAASTLSTVPEPSSYYPGAATGESFTVPAAVPVSRRPADDRAKLRRYLVTHTTHAPTGRQGMLSYRYIGMQSEKSPKDEEPATQ